MCIPAGLGLACHCQPGTGGPDLSLQRPKGVSAQAAPAMGYLMDLLHTKQVTARGEKGDRDCRSAGDTGPIEAAAGGVGAAEEAAGDRGPIEEEAEDMGPAEASASSL